ncbi:cytochrome P450 [Dentipellis sp. KUC8613]|nr:cytochrome P450 [Dentipellis sp. KUC8613]
MLPALLTGVDLTYFELRRSLSAYVLSWLIYRVVLYPRYLSPLRHVPGPPLGSVITGQFLNIIQSEAGMLQRDWVKQYGPAVRAVGPVGIERVMLLSPEAMHKVLVSDWMDFLKNILGIVAGYGLLTVTGNEHKQMRRAMNPAFSIPNLMAQTDMYYDSIEILIDILYSQVKQAVAPEGKAMHMYEWASKVTLDIICDTAFGYHSNSLRDPHNELTEAYEQLLNLQTGSNLALFAAFVSTPGLPWLFCSDLGYKYRHWLQIWKPLAMGTTLIDRTHRIRNIAKRMLSEKMADMAVDVEDIAAKKDIMSLLVRARKGGEKGEYKLSDGALVEQVLTFLGAGHETTASGISWTLWLLANDIRVQSKLREEVTAVFATNTRPGYRTLKELKTLECVVMESLRLLPPVPMTFRIAAKSDWVDGVWVPKGTLFYIPIRVVNTWKEVWGENAEDFYPERWLNLPEKYNPTYSFLSFITGPHGCIGKTMSISEMKAVIAALIFHFEFAPAYKGQVAKPTAAVTMKPEDSMPLLVKPVRRAM